VFCGVYIIIGVFTEARGRLKGHIVNYGYIESRGDYYNILSTCDVVVSTALHEFFGVAMYVYST